MAVALVTGGARGIGRAIVNELARSGYDVAFTYAADRESAAGVVAGLAGQGRRAVAHQADARDYARAEGVFADTERELGPVTVLVNNAGIRRDVALHNMTPAMWQEVIDTNLTGTFNYSRLGIGGMIRSGGAIVNIASASGLVGMAGQCNYSASKAGIIGLTKALAKEVARFGVRVNAIAPGFIETDMTASIDEPIRARLYANIPMRKAGTPDEVARLAAFLAGAEAAYITGQVYAIDGGLT